MVCKIGHLVNIVGHQSISAANCCLVAMVILMTKLSTPFYENQTVGRGVLWLLHHLFVRRKENGTTTSALTIYLLYVLLSLLSVLFTVLSPQF